MPTDLTTPTTGPALPWPPRRQAGSLDLPAPLVALLGGPPVSQVTLFDGGRAWLVTDHRLVRDVLRDKRFTAVTSAPGFPMMTQVSLAVRDRPASASFIRMDEPDHGRLRSMLTREFLRSTAEDARPAVRAWLDERLALLVARRHPVDLVTTLATPLPSATLSLMLGVPPEDTVLFEGCSATLIDHRTTPAQAVTARETLDAYLGELLLRRLAGAPGRGDLVARLVEDHVRPGHLPVEEAVPLVRLLMVAGHGTTANQGALSVLSLLTEPGLARTLRDEPDLLPGAVDELLRYHSIVHNGLARAATEDVQVGEVLVRAGEGVVLSLSAANRDPGEFTDPDTLDPRRTGGRHVAFGHGSHQCLGMWLARVELEELLSAVLRWLPDAGTAVPAERVPLRLTATNFGVLALPVTWPGQHPAPAGPVPPMVAGQARRMAELLTGGPVDPADPHTADGLAPGVQARYPGGFTAQVERWRAAGPWVEDGTDVVHHKAFVRLRHASTGAPHGLALTCDSTGLLRAATLAPTPTMPSVTTVDDVMDALARPGVEHGLLISLLPADGGPLRVLHEVGARRARPVGSVAKLYALAAVADAVKSGRLQWDDTMTVVPPVHSLPTGDTQDLPDGTAITLRTATVKMVALSDNTAHDLLVERVGREAVHRAVADLGHAEPALLTPFPLTRELFSLGWGGAVDPAGWTSADAAERERLLRRAATDPLAVSPADMVDAVHPLGLDWFASAHDVAAAWAGLLARTARDAEGVLETALTTNTGVPVDRRCWPWVAYKGGATPGALCFTWAVRDAAGATAVVVLQQSSPDPELLRDPGRTLALGHALLHDVLPSVLAALQPSR